MPARASAAATDRQPSILFDPTASVLPGTWRADSGYGSNVDAVMRGAAHDPVGSGPVATRAVPEPATVSLMSAGLLALLGVTFRRRRDS